LLPRTIQTYVRLGGNWKDGNWSNDFERPHRPPDPEPEGPGLVWRETARNHWSGSWGSQPRCTVVLESTGLWLAFVRLDEPPGLSAITTVGRFATAEEALLATDEIWTSR
jgi:hypothetical protein